MHLIELIINTNFKRDTQVPPSPNKCGVYVHMRASAPGRSTALVRSFMRGCGGGRFYPNRQAGRGGGECLQSRYRHVQHGRGQGALPWAYRGRVPPHTTGRTAQAGFNWAALVWVALGKACAGHRSAHRSVRRLRSQCTYQMGMRVRPAWFDGGLFPIKMLTRCCGDNHTDSVTSASVHQLTRISGTFSVRMYTYQHRVRLRVILKARLGAVLGAGLSTGLGSG